MTPHPVALNLQDTLDGIFLLLSEYKFAWLPVTVDDKLRGIIVQSDVLNALFRKEEKWVTGCHKILTIEEPANRKSGKLSDEPTEKSSILETLSETLAAWRNTDARKGKH